MDNTFPFRLQDAAESEENIASHLIYNDLMERNTTAMESIYPALLSNPLLTQNVDYNNSKTWKSNLSKFTDPVTLFQQDLSCDYCQNFETKPLGVEGLHKNSCQCNLPFYTSQRVQTIFLSSQESKSDDDQRVHFKPKLGKIRQIPTTNKKTLIKETETKSFGEISKTVSEELLSKEEEENKAHKSNVAKITFKTAKEQLLASNPAARRTLGASRKAQAKFVSPMLGAQENKQGNQEPEITDERLKHIDPKMIELIESEIIDKGSPIGWDDIAGLQMAKSVIQEAVVWPLLRPDIFTGLRRPPKGILLFGPPGTGKTLIGKCIASQCRATFFSISASSLTSKWIGDGEKMVRVLFAVARCHQPAVIFIDEIDSLLTQRSDTEHEATRRIKTEFLVQFDGAATGDDDRLLIVGATNRPQELDEAARRRLVKRLYIPLPDADARNQIISNLLKSESSSLTAEEVRTVGTLTEGYSGADVTSLCCEAALGPVRDLPMSQITTIEPNMVRPVSIQDFKNALQRVRPSVSQDDLGVYVKWNKTYGQGF